MPQLFDPTLIGIISTGIISGLILSFLFARIRWISILDGWREEIKHIAIVTMLYFIVWPIILFIGRFVWDLDIFATKNLWKISLFCILFPYLITIFLYYTDHLKIISWYWKRKVK